MEENTNIVETEVKDNTTDSKDEKGATATFTQEDVDKKVQSECDKLRTSYSKQIKDLQEQIKKLSPVEKSESEIAIENRLAELEKAQEEVNAQRHFSLYRTLCRVKALIRDLLHI